MVEEGREIEGFIEIRGQGNGGGGNRFRALVGRKEEDLLIGVGLGPLLA